MPAFLPIAGRSFLTGLGVDLAGQLIVNFTEFCRTTNVLEYIRNINITEIVAQDERALTLAMKIYEGTATDQEFVEFNNSSYGPPDSSSEFVMNVALIAMALDAGLRYSSENKYSLLTPFSYTGNKIMGIFKGTQAHEITSHEDTNSSVILVESPTYSQVRS